MFGSFVSLFCKSLLTYARDLVIKAANSKEKRSTQGTYWSKRCLWATWDWTFCHTGCPYKRPIYYEQDKTYRRNRQKRQIPQKRLTFCHTGCPYKRRSKDRFTTNKTYRRNVKRDKFHKRGLHKKTHKKDLQKRPTKKTNQKRKTKETYKIDSQKRPTKKIYHKDGHKRPTKETTHQSSARRHREPSLSVIQKPYKRDLQKRPNSKETYSL